MGDELTAHPCVPESVGEIAVSGLKLQGEREALRACFNADGPSHCELRKLD